jgi:hypothetical protein
MSVNNSNSTILNSRSAQPNLVGYGVTTSSTPEGTPTGCSLVAELESYIRSYVSVAETSYALVIALWLAATHVWTAFDAFPYLVVTSATKRSGRPFRREDFEG